MFLKNKTSVLMLLGALALPAVSAAEAADTVGNDLVPSSVVERREIVPGIAEYFFKVRVGAGQYDEIGLHRVVKETSPNVPARTSKAVFLAHGDIWNFRAAFLTAAQSAALPDDQALPVFLAENGVDVWGIDFRWTMVPLGAPGNLMQDWDLEQDARDLGVGLSVARITRALTGSGFSKINLLGWSKGGQISYAYLNGETQLPPGLRQVKGFIPVDIYLKTDDSSLQEAACRRQLASEGQLAGNVFANAIGSQIAAIGNDAIAGPGRTTGLVVGAATFALLTPNEPAPVYHFTGGTFDVNMTPTGLLYSNERALFDFEAAASPLQPYRQLADADAVVCEQDDVPFDDHLGDITVPVLYVGAGGGFGDLGIYTTTLLGSTDVQTLVVSKVPVAQRLVDYGHADLFLAGDAETLVWQPILDWIKTH